MKYNPEAIQPLEIAKLVQDLGFEAGDGRSYWPDEALELMVSTAWAGAGAGRCRPKTASAARLGAGRRPSAYILSSLPLASDQDLLCEGMPSVSEPRMVRGF